jgi:uncharacterized protein YydD (DUF2326 family)
MILNKIYAEPSGLFEDVQFRNGINVIFASKDEQVKGKSSLNGVGKSLLLNFLDYALLSSTTAHIKSAKKNNDLEHYSIVLEFSIEKTEYIIKRSLGDSSSITIIGPVKTRNFDSAIKARKFLCNTIFKRDGYDGKFSDRWLRKLLPFFIKKQENPKTKVNFLDPIKYSRSQEMELIPYHLLFLGINNRLFWRNFEIKSELKQKTAAIKEVTSFIEDTYNLKDIPQAENRIDRLKNEVKEYEINIDKFQLSDQYDDAEEEGNILTTEIKDLSYSNHLDEIKLKNYKASLDVNDSISPIKIRNLYKDLNLLLAGNIKKTLDEAIQFRKEIAESREEFLSAEIIELKQDISERKKAIGRLEQKRVPVFEFLSAKNAIDDLTKAYQSLSRKKDSINELEGQIRLYQDLNREKNEREAEIAKGFLRITNFIVDNKDQVSDFRGIFFDVYESIYPENKKKNYGFLFEPCATKDSKVKMEVFLPAELATGKNNARTLIYDLSVLLHGISQNLHLPKFLIHDGIFDGMDPSHFISLYEYVEKTVQKTKFQYIVTLNEEGELDGRFGDTDKVNSKRIKEDAILNLTPSKKLLRVSWD